MNPREAAYIALNQSLRHESFIIVSLEKWQMQTSPTHRDFSLAYEIASGSCRMALALDYIAIQLSSSKKLSLKLKEKALLRTAIYQYYFMTKIPLYAIVNETIELAKKYCHASFVSYLNALLRQLSTYTPEWPDNLSIQYSYPQYFIEELKKNYTNEETIKILSSGNKPPVIMAKSRLQSQEIPLAEIIILDSPDQIKQIAQSKDYYIQNATPILLTKELSKQTPIPKNILDLCASPGGKLIAAHDFFPDAELYANDISHEKISRLTNNLKKYNIHAHLSCGPGEHYSTTNRFDLIILDVPCSNSGVLNKRAEARFRLSKENLAALNITQKALLKSAAKMLNVKGVLWYLTCSILPDENLEFLNKTASKIGLKVIFSHTILPDISGNDGGFSALLIKI